MYIRIPLTRPTSPQPPHRIWYKHDSQGLGFQVKVVELFQGVASLRRMWAPARASKPVAARMSRGGPPFHGRGETGYETVS